MTDYVFLDNGYYLELKSQNETDKTFVARRLLDDQHHGDVKTSAVSAIGVKERMLATFQTKDRRFGVSKLLTIDEFRVWVTDAIERAQLYRAVLKY